MEYYDADRWKFLCDYDLPKKQKKQDDEGPRFCYSIAEELLTTDFEQVPSIWGNFLPRNGVVCIAGESECGKSIFLRQLAIEYCTNTTGRFLGMKFDNRSKRALYISTEDDYYAFSALLKKQCKELNVKPEDLKNMYVVFQNNKIIEKIENFLHYDAHVGLIIIDCLNDILPNQATSDIALRKFLNRLQDIATNCDCMFILSHHTSKYARKKTPSKHNLKGPQGIEERCRTVFEIRTDNFQKNIKHLCVVKANYINDEDKKKSYMLELTPQLIFKNTGRRTDIDTLTLMPDSIDEKVLKYKELRDSGLKGDELAKAMGFASRGSLSVWVKKNIKDNTEQTNNIKDSTEPTNNINDNTEQTTNQPSSKTISSTSPTVPIKHQLSASKEADIRRCIKRREKIPRISIPRFPIPSFTRSLVYPFIRSPNKKPCSHPFMGGVITSSPRVRRHPCLRRV